MYIDSIHVDIRHRRKGIARKEISKAAKKEGAITIGLTATSASKPKWKKMGFSFIGYHGKMEVSRL